MRCTALASSLVISQRSASGAAGCAVVRGGRSDTPARAPALAAPPRTAPCVGANAAVLCATSSAAHMWCGRIGHASPPGITRQASPSEKSLTKDCSSRSLPLRPTNTPARQKLRQGTMGSDDGAKKAKEMVVGPDGMPDMTGAKPGSFAPMLLGFTFIPLAIGLAIASAIYKYGSTGAYDSNMKTIIEKDMHWVYLAVVVFGRMIVFVNIVPMAYKSKVCALVTVCRVRVRSVRARGSHLWHQRGF